MTVQIGEWYGEADNRRESMDTALGEINVIVNSWDYDGEYVTQTLDDPKKHPIFEEHGITGWLAAHLVATVALREHGFSVKKCIDASTVCWEK